MSSDPIIRLTDVSIHYERHRPPVLSDVNLSIDRGSFTAITGPNGGGKTTLLRVILRLLRPTSGRVEYLRDGHPVKRLSIGYLPQKSNIDSRFPITVKEVMLSGLIKSLRPKVDAASARRLREVIDLCGCSHIADRSIGELSGGQLQRTLLGRAIISRPEILVLDEPLSYVDRHFEQQIYALMERLSQVSTIILVSHQMSVISGMAHRHLIVQDGHLHDCHAHSHYSPTACD